MRQVFCIARPANSNATLLSLDDLSLLNYPFVMRTLRRYLTLAAIVGAAFICVGCDDDDDQGNLAFLGRAWLPVPSVFVTPASNQNGSTTP
jgi:hypothetical protein